MLNHSENSYYDALLIEAMNDTQVEPDEKVKTVRIEGVYGTSGNYSAYTSSDSAVYSVSGAAGAVLN
jgi:hypothetical protein